MINKAVAEIGYIKDKHFKNKSFQFLLAIIMYVIFFVIVGAYLIFRIFFFVDSNKDIVEFKSSINPNMAGLFWSVENVTPFVSKVYNLNIANFDTIKDISYKDKSAIEITLANGNTFIINFENMSSKDKTIAALQDYYKTQIPNKKIDFTK